MKRLLPNSLNLPSKWQDVRTRALVPAGIRVREWRDWVVDNDPVYGSFRRPGRTEKIAASVTMLLILAVATFLLLFDWNWVRGPIGRWASAKYDREIALQGDLDVNLFSGTPSVIVNDLKFGGPDWAREADTANVERIEARFRLRKLFAGQIEMPLLAITGPNVVLISTEDGRQSWELEPHKPDTGEGMKLPLINQLIIQDGRISLDARDRDITLEAAISAREAASAAEGDSGFTLTGEGSVNGAPLTLKIEGGAFVNIRRNRPYHFEATLAGARSRLVVDGAITRPFDLGQFTSTLSLQGQDLNDLYLLTGVTLPNTPPYRLSGALTRNDAVWTFNDFTGRVGASDLSGDMTVDAGERLRVEAVMSSRLLDIDDMMAILGADTRTNAAGTNTTVVASGAGPAMLLPDGTLQVDRLRTMDGTLTYRATSVKANDLDIRRVNLGAVLEGGILDLDPVSFDFNRGELNGTARINATRDTPYSAVDFRLAGYPLESIIPAKGGVAPVSGRALGRARLEGPGNSIHRFAAGSRGSLSLVVPQGEMRAAFAELLGVNASAGLLKLLSGDQSRSSIRCAVADFEVSNGVARAKTFVVDTDVVLAQGSGTINLGTETLDLKIDGESKKPRLLRLWTPIRVRGHLSAPSASADVGQLVAQAGLTGLLAAVVAPVAALFAFVDPGLAKDANCGSLIANAR
ncbi:AsmA family protein [Brevundimonas sp.]|uniref:AsmA family protein n=1 Tax=Brevundimonas sp. TaxID=1871086 RepID=UPI00286A133A|nr:AsmA family protein [Brevundimonas sp.]